MATERELELLDDYIANKLTGGDKDAFEQRLNSDASLQNEFKLQNNLIEGIKKARLAELKSMLNNTAVPPVQGGQAALLGKVASWLVVTGILSAGIYFYFNKEDDKQDITERTENPAVSQPAEETTQVIVPGNEPLATEQKIETKELNKETEKAIKANETIKRKDVIKPNSAASVSTETKAINREKPDVFDPSSEAEGNSEPQNDAVKISATQPKLIASSIEVTTDNTNKKYNFHYQFENGKLFLFGSFEENLYEIMEFFNDNKRTVFLYYKDSFYLLNEANEKIRPLASINDPVLQQKLKEYRGNN
jgi:hypothetical protein